jgi:transposase
VSKEEIIQERDRQISHLAEENLLLKEQLDWFRRQLFGQKRERFIPVDPDQLEMELGLEKSEAPAPETEQISYERVKQKPKTKPTGRQPWPADLPRVVIDLAAEVDDLDNYLIVGYEITEELEYSPEELFVRQFRRPKLLRKPEVVAQDESPQPQFVTAQAPDRPLPKLSVGSRMLAQIICDKFLDHLPLYRQIKRFERKRVKLAKSTVSGWVMAVCQLLAPLFEANRRLVLSSSYLQVDETTIQVLDLIRVLPKNGKKRKKPPPPGKSHRGYYWVYYDPLTGLALFDYHPGRGGKYPRETLKNFEGILQTDGYTVYEAFDRRAEIILIGCLAHVRRKFFEAQNGNKAQEAKTALSFIKRLYLIEKRARELVAEIESPEEAFVLRYQLRQRWAKPLVAAAKGWLQQQAKDPKALPKSGFGKAVSHALKRFKYLERYLDNGRVEIDNNLVENSIRPIALGRKNYLFAGSEQAAINAGNLYSLLAAAKAHDLNPVDYLRDLIETLPNHPITRIEELLPHRWQPNLDLPIWLDWTPDDQPTKDNPTR